MDYVISVCSTVDLPRDYVRQHNLPFLPYTYVINGKEYNDDLGETMSAKEFYKQVREGAMPSTSQINIDKYTAFFEPFLKEGKDLLHMTLSTGITNSYNNARLAVDELKTKYPERKIFLVDSLSASMGYGLLTHYALKMKEEGKTIDEVYKWVEENKRKINHWFTVDDLFHLKRGGRVSGAAAVVGTLLQIKPVLNIDDEGHLIPKEKARGRKQALNELVSKMEELVENPDGQDIFISHGDSEEDANYVAKQVKAKFPGINCIVMSMIGPVIGAHSGPGTVALFFYGKSR